MIKPTPTEQRLTMRRGDFATLGEALDYAGEGETGFNFYSGRGELVSVLSYEMLRQKARETARRFIAMNLAEGARVALVADTVPGFMVAFFACQYAGYVPVPLPVTVGLGSRDAYTRQLKSLLAGCEADVALAPDAFMSFLENAAADMSLTHLGSYETLDDLPMSEAPLAEPDVTRTAYLQYTSGSTQFPRGRSSSVS